MFRIVHTYLILNLISSLLANEDFPKVNIKQGELQGGIGRTQHDRLYYYFTGIPYAKPPVGWYRFQLPSTPSPWNGTFDATQTASSCFQFEDEQYANTKGSEDCLYLNVYTPQLPDGDNKALPVMFYIGGENFQFNDVSKEKVGPELLLDKDVVLVTINYRLGIFGFFVTEDNTLPYNVGLKDQAYALKWVKNNIDKFGGDPNRITVFGNGAGGASAHYLMLSPMSKDLITGVIAQSGTVLNLWAYAPIPLVGVRSRTVAGIVGCPTKDKIEVMVKCLKTVKAFDILNATLYIMGDAGLQLFKPVLERNRDNAFLPLDPIDIISKGLAADVPFLSGITTQNGAHQTEFLLNNPSTIEKLNNEFEEYGSWILQYGITAVVKNRIPFGKKIKEFYFKDNAIDQSTRKELTKLNTDALFLEGLRLSTEMHAKYSKKPVYSYLFGYSGSESYLKSEKKNGVSFKDELLYLFKNQADFPNYEPNDSDNEMTELLLTLWTNFATFGNPTPPDDTSISFKWDPVTIIDDNYLLFKQNGERKMDKDMLSKRSHFWKNLAVDTRRNKIRDEL